MITAAQRTQRQQFIGSSDAAAILGLDPHRTPLDVWYEKTGKLDEFEGNEATDRGNDLEPALLNFAERELGEPLERNVFVQHDDCPALAANLDALANERISPVEAKSSMLCQEWGNDGPDDVPERVIIQVHHQMACLGLSSLASYVPVILPFLRMKLYAIERNADIIDAIETRCTEFMDVYVKRDIRPPDTFMSLESIKRVRRQPETIVPVSDELVDAYLVARAFEAQAKDDLKAAQEKLLTSLGTAEGGAYSKGLVTYMLRKRKGYTVAETQYRQIQIKPAKGAKT